MTLKIKTATWISGEPVKVGEIIQTDDETGKELLRLGRAEPTSTPAKQTTEKPSFTREK